MSRTAIRIRRAEFLWLSVTSQARYQDPLMGVARGSTQYTVAAFQWRERSGSSAAFMSVFQLWQRRRGWAITITSVRQCSVGGCTRSTPRQRSSQAESVYPTVSQHTLHCSASMSPHDCTRGRNMIVELRSGSALYYLVEGQP